ncbi:MAG: ATP-binding cassette domain-containing protein, partial [Devosia sp.]
RRERQERVIGLMEQVGLEPAWRERYPHAFSGGQRQRIGIARAIAVKPRLIVADEATSALDVSLRAQMLDLMIKLQDELGLAFIFISHDMSVIRYMCDRVAVMYRGKIVETGPADEVTTRPTHDYTRALLSAIPNPDPDNRRLSGRFRYQAQAFS